MSRFTNSRATNWRATNSKARRALLSKEKAPPSCPGSDFLGCAVPEEDPMTYLELAPAISALRSRPEEFEFSNNTLHHLRSRHSFHFVGEDDLRIHAACDCASLRASPEQT